MKTLYDVLGVPWNASEETIRTAFRKAAKSYHPDLNTGDPTAEQQFRQLIAAYEMLKNPHQRAAYDHYLKTTRHQGARGFAMTTVAGLVSGSIVAVGIWLSISLSSEPPAPGLAGANVTQATGRQVAVTDDRGLPQVLRGSRMSDWALAAPNRRPADRQPQHLHQIAASNLQQAASNVPPPAASTPPQAAASNVPPAVANDPPQAVASAPLPAAAGNPPEAASDVRQASAATNLPQATNAPSASDVPLTASYPEAQALVAREWERVQASGDPLAISE